MKETLPKILIGLVTYNDLSFLRESLPAMREAQERLGADLVLMDTAWNKDVRDFVTKQYPSFEYFRHPDGNIGYGKSYNEILKRKLAESYDLFLVVTSDVLLNVSVLERFVKRMQKNPSIALCAGKLHYWDFKQGVRTNLIDTLGIVANKNHHFYDRGQGEEDHGQYDENLGDFFGISGAVFLIRTSVIPRLHGQAHLLFDPAFWMYKEDIDLSYRLRWLGEKIELFPEVWGWHARTVANKKGQNLRGLTSADREKKDYARFHSYRNHFLLLKNNFTFEYGVRVFLRVFLYEMAKGLYMVFRSPKAFFEGVRVLFFVKGKRSPRKVPARKMLSFFNS